MTDYTEARIQLLDEDYALVDRMTIDEAAAALKQSDDPAIRKHGEILSAALKRTIASVADDQRRAYEQIKAAYTRDGVTYRMPEALLP